MTAIRTRPDQPERDEQDDGEDEPRSGRPAERMAARTRSQPTAAATADGSEDQDQRERSAARTRPGRRRAGGAAAATASRSARPTPAPARTIRRAARPPTISPTIHSRTIAATTSGAPRSTRRTIGVVTSTGSSARGRSRRPAGSTPQARTTPVGQVRDDPCGEDPRGDPTTPARSSRRRPGRSSTASSAPDHAADAVLVVRPRSGRPRPRGSPPARPPTTTQARIASDERPDQRRRPRPRRRRSTIAIRVGASRFPSPTGVGSTTIGRTTRSSAAAEQEGGEGQRPGGRRGEGGEQRAGQRRSPAHGAGLADALGHRGREPRREDLEALRGPPRPARSRSRTRAKSPSRRAAWASSKCALA